jgi:hypothetical protein
MIIPFRIKIDDEYNEEIEFIFRATTKGYYSVLLTYDPIKEEYIKTKCECWDYKMGLKKDENYQCKHIKEAIEVIENHKKELNKGELL